MNAFEARRSAFIRIFRLQLVARMSKAILIMIAITAQATSAQVGGTLIIFNFAKDKLIVAGDSLGKSNKPGRSDYHQCKLSVFEHQTVFVTTGAAVRTPDSDLDPVGSWTNAAIARTTVKIAETHDFPDYQARIDGMAELWTKALAERWQSWYEWRPHEVQKCAEDGNGTLTAGVFAEIHEGKVYTAIGGIFFDGSKPGPIVGGGTLNSCWPCTQSEAWRLCAIGKVEIPTELCTQSTPRAKAAARTWSSLLKKRDGAALLAIRVAELTVAYDTTGTIGGEVDALEISNAGVRWIRRKPNCPENQD